MWQHFFVTLPTVILVPCWQICVWQTWWGTCSVAGNQSTQCLSSLLSSISPFLCHQFFRLFHWLHSDVWLQTQSCVCRSGRGARGQLFTCVCFLQNCCGSQTTLTAGWPQKLLQHSYSTTVALLQLPVIVRSLANFWLIRQNWYFARPVFGPREDCYSQTTVPHRTPLSPVLSRNVTVEELPSADHSFLKHKKSPVFQVHISLKVKSSSLCSSSTRAVTSAWKYMMISWFMWWWCSLETLKSPDGGQM